nr:phospholipase-like, aminotransferase-like mobile domain protein [Tanacetum cinerariifolium]
ASFIFDLTHEEFVNELAHIISPPEYDRFYFKDLPDLGELMSVLNFKIRENLSKTLVNLPIEDDYSPLLAYVVWIFVAYLTLLHLAGSQPMLKSSYKAEDGVIISIPPLVGGVADVVVEIKGTANKDPVNKLVDALDDLVDENCVVEVEKDLSEDDGLKVQKLEAENKRLAEQRRIRFNKMKEQENDMKSSYFSNSSHMKLNLEKCGTNKRKFTNVLRPPVEEYTYVKVLSIDTLKKQNNVLDQYMIEKCQQLKP